MAAGTSRTCVFAGNGVVYCWGRNYFGQLGNNSVTDSHLPVQVAGVGGTGYLSGVAALAGGIDHTCARTTADLVYCWGRNQNAQLGNNSTKDSLVPVGVTGF